VIFGILAETPSLIIELTGIQLGELFRCLSPSGGADNSGDRQSDEMT
jgi:hypothetical protein